MLRSLLFLLFAFLFSGEVVQGQQHTRSLVFEHLRTDNGLAGNNVWSLYKDRRGYLWAGTENGLSRFDGLNCKTYRPVPNDSTSLQGRDIFQIIEDRYGNLWLGTQQNLARYNLATDRFTNFYPLRDAVSGPPVYQYVFPFFIDHQERLWTYLGYKGGVYAVQPRTGRIDSVTDFSNGYLFAGQPFYTPLRRQFSRGIKGLFITDLQGTKAIRTRTFFTHSYSGAGPDAIVDQVLVESDSIAWVCTDIGLIRLQVKTGAFRIISDWQGQSVSAHCIVKTDSGKFLVGTDGMGVLVYDDRVGKFIHQYRHEPYNPASLSSNTVYRMLLDGEGHLFLAVADRGLDYTRISGPLFESYLTPDEAAANRIENNVTALLPLDGSKVLVGTQSSGLLCYDLQQRKIIWQRSLAAGELNAGRISTLLKADGSNVLLQTDGHFAICNTDNGQLQPLSIRIDSHEVRRVLVHSLMQYPAALAATEEGLMEWRLNGNTLDFTPVSTVNRKAEWAHFQAIIPLDSRSFLLQAYATNLYLVERESEQWVLKKEIARTPFRTYGAIRAGEKLYLATSNGLLRIKLPEMQLDATPYRIAVPCSGLAYLPSGTLWVSTINGLYSLRPESGVLRHYSREDGLQDNLFNPGCIVAVSGNRVLAGGTSGFNDFDPDKTNLAPLDAEVQLTQIQVADSMYRKAGNPVTVQKLNLEYWENTVAISYSTIDFTRPEQNTVRYQLEDYDKAPVVTGPKGTARYVRLPPGNYRFSVWLEGSKARRTVLIHIAVPFWKTIWFYLLVLAAIVASIIIIFRSRLQTVNRRQKDRLRVMITSQEEERRRIARDLHDDFGARLSTLKLYVQAAGKDPQLLSQTGGMIDDAIRDLRSILYNLSPKILEEGGLRAALEDMAAQLNRSGVIQAAFSIHPPGLRLPPAMEYSLYRMVQEMINNTLKHAQATEIQLSIVAGASELTMMYEDNGRGFTTDVSSRGYGLTNMGTHAQAMNGTIDIDSTPGHGTTIAFNCPLPHSSTR